MLTWDSRGNAAFLSRLNTTHPIPRHVCEAWYNMQLVAGEVMILLLEISLIHRCELAFLPHLPDTH